MLPDLEDALSCLTLSEPMDCSLPGSSIHGIFQARVLEWSAIAKGHCHPRASSGKDRRLLIQLNKCLSPSEQLESKIVIDSQGEGNGNPLQYSCLENPMDGGAW